MMSSNMNDDMLSNILLDVESSTFERQLLKEGDYQSHYMQLQLGPYTKYFGNEKVGNDQNLLKVAKK